MSFRYLLGCLLWLLGLPSWASSTFLGAFFVLCRLLGLPSWASVPFLGALNYWPYVEFLVCLLGLSLPSWVPSLASWSVFLGFLYILGCLLGLMKASWSAFLGFLLPSWVPSWPAFLGFGKLLGLSLTYWVPSSF